MEHNQRHRFYNWALGTVAAYQTKNKSPVWKASDTPPLLDEVVDLAELHPGVEDPALHVVELVGPVPVERAAQAPGSETGELQS